MNADITDYSNVDMTIWCLILQADVIVRIVMLVLLIASIFCWTIIFDKSRKFKKLRMLADEFETNFWSGISLDNLHKQIGSAPSHPMEAVFISGMKEWRLNSNNKNKNKFFASTDIIQRIDQVMSSSLNREMEIIEKNINFLATTGSTAPFIGLFGTVWGIMNSFQSIATSQNTSLAIVAPGIAEALLATALGLLAAIPAVIAYNKFSSDYNRYEARLETFLSEFVILVSRHINEQDSR